MLSFFRRATKKEASPLPQPGHVLAHHATAKPSGLKITLASQPLRQGAVLSIEPRYWIFPSSSSRPAPIPNPAASQKKLALFFGTGGQEEEDDDEDEEGVILRQASQENAPVYLRFVLVGEHRALAKASSKAILRLDHDGASCVWPPGKQAVHLVVPETATRFLSGDLSLVVEAFQQEAESGKDVLLARGVVHHFIEHLQKAEAPRVLVLPLVSTSPAIGSSTTSSDTSRGSKKQGFLETRSEACICLTYFPLVPPRQCRYADVKGEVIDRKLNKGQLGISKKDVQGCIKKEKVESKMEKKADTGKAPPGSGSEESAGVRQQQQHAPKTQEVEDERVSSVGSHLHLDLAASLVEQIRQEQESKVLHLRMPGQEVVRTSEQEGEDKVVEIGAQEEAKVSGQVQALKGEVKKPILLADVVRHGGRTAAAAGAAGAAAGAAAEYLPTKPAGTPLPAPLGERRQRHTRRSTASAARRRAQLARVNRLLADLETLPTTLTKGGWMVGAKGPGRVEMWGAEKRLATK